MEFPASVTNWWLIFLLISLVACVGVGADIGKREQKKEPRPHDDVAFCEGRVSAYFVSDNVNINSTATTVIKNVTEQRCLDLCASNRDAKGRWVFCASVIYDREQSICAIHRRASSPDGEAWRRSEPGKRYFEKFCLAEDLPLACADRQFVRVDEFILKGYAQATANYPTMAECAAHCVREKKFECKSAMYFHEEGECITNTESAITRPEDFMRPDDDDKVIFFHNGCLGSKGESASSNEDSASKPPLPSSTKPIQRAVQLPTRGHKSLPIGRNRGDSRRHPTSAPKDPSVQIEEARDDGSDNDADEGPIELPFSSTAATKPSASFTLNSPSSTKSSVSTSPQPAIVVDTTPQHQPQESSTPAEGSRLNQDSGKVIKVKEDEGSVEAAEAEKFRPTPRNVINTPKLYGARALEEAADGSIHQTNSSSSASAEHSSSWPLRQEGEKVEMPATLLSENHEATTGPTIKQNPNVPRAHTPQHSAGAVQPVKILGIEPTKKLQLKAIKQSHLSPTLELPIPQMQQHGPPPGREAIVKRVPGSEIGGGEGALGSGNSGDGEAGYFSKWGDWTPCSQAGERRIRRRKCLDLRRCKGALMQVDYCPKDLKVPLPLVEEEPEEAGQQDGPAPPVVRNPLPINAPTKGTDGSGGAPPSILPPKMPQKELKPLPEGAPGKATDIWSPWPGECQKFASVQPCTNQEMIGFEARECIAKDPVACKGPFFRYCTMKC